MIRRGGDHGGAEGAGLSQAQRTRLDRFAAEFDRLDAAQYAMFATTDGDEPAVRAAIEAARTVAGTAAARAALDQVVASFRDAAAQAYSRRLAQTDTILLFQSLVDRPEDRVRFLASLERAVVGVVLWEALDPADLVVLVGPWAEVVARVAPLPEGPGT